MWLFVTEGATAARVEPTTPPPPPPPPPKVNMCASQTHAYTTQQLQHAGKNGKRPRQPKKKLRPQPSQTTIYPRGCCESGELPTASAQPAASRYTDIFHDKSATPQPPLPSVCLASPLRWPNNSGNPFTTRIQYVKKKWNAHHETWK